MSRKYFTEFHYIGHTVCLTILRTYLELIQELLLPSDVSGQDERADLALHFNPDILSFDQATLYDAADGGTPVMVLQYRCIL